MNRDRTSISRHDFLRLTVVFTGAALAGGLGCAEDLDLATRRPGAGSGEEGEEPGTGGTSDGGVRADGGGQTPGDGGETPADGGETPTDGGPPPAEAGVDAGPANACRNNVVLGQNQIVNFHNHGVTIPAADFTSTTAKTYNIMGTSAHAHEITITPQQFTTLRGGGEVVVTSTNVNGHTHACTVKCA